MLVSSLKITTITQKIDSNLQKTHHTHVACVVTLGFRASNGNGTVPEISSFNIVSKKESSGQKPFTKIIYIVSQMSVLLF